jgi:hypothetical protein
MVRVHNGAVVPSQADPPRAAGSMLTARALLGALLFTIFIAAVVAVFVAAASGQVAVAIVIGLVSGAFFAGLAC